MIDGVSGNSINSMMDTIRAFQQKAAGGIDQIQFKPPQVQDVQAPKTELPNFTESVKNLLDKVNETQVKSNNLQEAYQRGEDVPLTDVVLGMQKSSLAFEATLQVRNKVLRAYEEIMNMPV